MSTISLCIRPEAIPFEWEEFCTTHGPYTIGLDGYVAAGSRFDPSGPRLNLDHHTEVDRLAARATCAQTLLTIRQGSVIGKMVALMTLALVALRSVRWPDFDHQGLTDPLRSCDHLLF